jgi:threonylcarbamoyladenosine tRNA methylthiotransferase MtaB
VSTLRNEGYREIVLTGIHLGLYGLDLPASPDLAGLLRRIEDETSLERLRISSIEPMEISESLIETLSSSSAICRHLHIPLQSGSNRILSGMKRSYTAEDFRRRIEGIADRIPDIAIGVDVMTGFPGEGEDEFDATRSLLESLPLAYLHVFPYSKRPGTEAADFAGQVAETDKKERAAILRNLGAEKKRAFFTRYIGETLSVLVEAKPEGAKGRLKGFSGNYIPTAIIEGTASLINSIVDVKTVYIEGNALVGRIA